MLRGLKARLPGLLVGALLVGLPLGLLVPALSPAALLTLVVGLLWLWSLLRRAGARLATRALARGDIDRAHRLYLALRYTSLDAETRRSCALSLAACVATGGSYQAALTRVAQVGESLEGAQKAVSLNLRAYCYARLGRDLDQALSMSEQAILLRPQVLGFRHTRGLVLLELGRLDEASRDLDATWRDGDGNQLLESERCFDLGRLWAARGHSDYATDYFERCVRAWPESRWAREALPHLDERATDDSLDLLSAYESG